MDEHRWLASNAPRVLLAQLTRLHTRLGRPVSERKLRYFAYYGCRLAWPTVTDERSRAAIEAGERVLIGACSNEEFAQAVRGARDACDEAYTRASGPHNQGAYNAAQGVALTFRAVLGVQQWNSVCKVRDALMFGGLVSTPSEVTTLLAAFADVLRDIFGNPCRPVATTPEFRTSTAVALARHIYLTGDFGVMPFLADALQDAGCDNTDVLNHCRGPGPHVRGCWVLEMLLTPE